MKSNAVTLLKTELTGLPPHNNSFKSPPVFADNDMGVIIKKLFIVCLLPLVAAAVVFAQPKAASAETPVVFDTHVSFHGFPWGTSLADFSKKVGKPVSREDVNGLTSVVYENVEVSGFITYMVAFFSKTGLEGGTYYFVTPNLDELMRCYNEMRLGLRDRYGPTLLFDGIIKERRPYECSWKLPGGYVYLKVNTRVDNAPVTLWCSSPALTKKLLGIDLTDNKTYTAKQ